MRDMGVRGLLVFYADYRCSHSIAITITNKGAAPTGTWLLTCRCTLGQLQPENIKPVMQITPDQRGNGFLDRPINCSV